MKLYFYYDTHIFYCYSNCEAMSIFKFLTSSIISSILAFFIPTVTPSNSNEIKNLISAWFKFL